jgi:hypothetical protein
VFTYPSRAPHTYDFVVLIYWTHPRKILLVVLQIGKAKDLSAPLRPFLKVTAWSSAWVSGWVIWPSRKKQTLTDVLRIVTCRLLCCWTRRFLCGPCRIKESTRLVVARTSCSHVCFVSISSRSSCWMIWTATDVRNSHSNQILPLHTVCTHIPCTDTQHFIACTH